MGYYARLAAEKKRVVALDKGEANIIFDAASVVYYPQHRRADIATTYGTKSFYNIEGLSIHIYSEQAVTDKVLEIRPHSDGILLAKAPGYIMDVAVGVEGDLLTIELRSETVK